MENLEVSENVLDFEDIKCKLLKPLNFTSKKDKFKEIEAYFECFNFNSLKIKNHFCYINLSDDMLYNFDGLPNEKFFNFYKNISDSEVGLIITGGVYNKLKKDGISNASSIDIISQKALDIHSRYVKNIHQNGTKIFLQLKSIYGREDDLNKLFNVFNLSASMNPNPKDVNSVCMRISDNKCDDIVKNFGELALFSKNCGYDGILINGESSNIIGEFASINLNKRKFGYFSNNSELSIKILKEISRKCKNINILYSITIDDFINQIFDKESKNIKSIKNFTYKKQIDKILKFLLELINYGVDGYVFKFGIFENKFLNVFNSFQKYDIFECFYKEIANFFNVNNIKNKCGNNVKIIYNDNFSSLSNILKTYNKCFDFIDVTKNILSDFNYIKNLKTNKSSVNCIKCSHCNYFADKKRNINCVVNPTIFIENNMISIDSVKKNVAIIGAGISGIFCALYLSERGYYVEIFEKSNIINKNNRLCEVFGYDKELKQLNDYIEDKLMRLLKENKIKLNLNCVFDKNFLFKHFDSIIIATGFCEKLLSLNGSILKNVKSIYDVLSDEQIINNSNKITIYARTELSLKLAIFLLLKGKIVSVILTNFDGLESLSDDKFSYYFYELNKLKANIYFNSKVKRIEHDFVELLINNKLSKYSSISIAMNLKSNLKYQYEPRLINIDNDLFIYEPELYSNNKLYYDLVMNQYEGKLFMIGNALQIQDLSEDIKSAYFVAKNL